MALRYSRLGFVVAALAFAGRAPDARAEGSRPGPWAPPAAAENPAAEGADPQDPPPQLSAKFKIHRDNPEADVPPDEVKNKNPLEFGYFVQDLLAQAEEARKQKDYGALVRYYRAVAKSVPEMAKGWSKLCEAYRLVNDPVRAARSCKNALERPGAELNDFVTYVGLMAQKQEPLESDERTSVLAVLDHLDKDSSASPVTVSQLRCQAGVKLHDVKMLETCTAALAKLAPDDAKTIVYQWDLAVRKGKNAEAARLLERAKDLGLPADNIERMVKFTPAATSSPGTILWSAVGGAFLLAAIGWGVWNARRRRAFAEQVAP
jgi:predicted Zn-dependent protease